MARGFPSHAVRTAAAIAIVAGAACGGSSAPATTDLIAQLPKAERRAIKPEIAIRTALAGPAADRRMAIITDTPARITWTLRLPPRAHVTTAVQILPDAGGTIGGAAARIGISDNRSYQQLARVVLDASTPAQQWLPIDVDLAEYSGWKFSLFYHPSRQDWRIIFGADAAPGRTIAWAQPEIASASR
jgi:hypothetical protein